MDDRGIIAASRFGLGPHPDQQVPADAQEWLDSQLDDAEALRLPAGRSEFPTIADGFATLEADRLSPPSPGEQRAVGQMLRSEAMSWAQQGLMTAQPFRERLVHFWTNHFTVSRRRGQVVPFAGCYVRDAIRPHVTGRLSDMLLAVVRHPAMLIYLDNVGSVGPNSPAGQRNGRGLNENLARELLELHTLSPAAGYRQSDVTEFARVLTGWSVERGIASGSGPAGFAFRPRAHEPGSKTVLGQSYPEGEAGGVAALHWLAGHPATHRHLATKLVRHFVADEPPQRAVQRIAAVLHDTDGDLGAVARALVRLPEAWSPPLSKLRAPQDFVFAALRAVGAGAAAAGPTVAALAALGQPLWSAPAPNGWPDVAGEWATPEALMRRTDFGWNLAGRVAAGDMPPDPRRLPGTALGGLAGAETVQAIGRAGSARDAFTLLFASPEFQRR